jgi:hypothetical protein
LVRRIYLNILAINPKVKLSMAAIAFGAPPVSEANWLSSAAYSTVFQDWRAWLEEGIIDMAIPMNYDREHCASQQQWYDGWLEWDKNHRYHRHVVIGQGPFLNGIPGTIAQVRRAGRPSSRGNLADGVTMFSYWSTTSTITQGCTGSNSVNDPALYPALSMPSMFDPDPVPVFAERVPTPDMPWKTSPTAGHVMGTVRFADGRAVDGAVVEILREVGPAVIPVKRTRTDGSGFFGAVDLPPGVYEIRVVEGETPVATTSTQVAIGEVAIVEMVAP